MRETSWYVYVVTSVLTQRYLVLDWKIGRCFYGTRLWCRFFRGIGQFMTRRLHRTRGSVCPIEIYPDEHSDSTDRFFTGSWSEISHNSAWRVITRILFGNSLGTDFFERPPIRHSFHCTKQTKSRESLTRILIRDSTLIHLLLHRVDSFLSG